MFKSDGASLYLHEESSQQSSFDVEGVRFGAKGRLGDGELDSIQGVGQLRSDGLGRLQGRMIQEVVLAPLFGAEVWEEKQQIKLSC